VKLGIKHKRAIIALLGSNSIKQAAANVGIGERTLHSWLHDADFRQALVDAETEMIGHVVRVLTGTALDAVAALRACLNDEFASHHEKISAARVVLSALPQLKLMGDVEARLTRLENELQ